MRSDAKTIKEYLNALPADRKSVLEKIRQTIANSLPEGFAEQMGSGMISYVVPLHVYPKGYHAKKGEPLPFLALASQKNHIALYHFGLYGDETLKDWFVNEYAQRMPTKLDMDKSCIRFKNLNTIPYDLIGELLQKMTVADYIDLYEKSLVKNVVKR